MLNIFKLKTKKVKKEFNIKHESDNYLWNNKYYPSANREWSNSIYYFNNNNNILLPNIDTTAYKIIKSYFNMYNHYLEKRIKLPFIKKWKRRYKTRRFWISKTAVKHTNDKVIITLFIYNRQYNYLINKLNNLKKKLILNYNINNYTYKYIWEIKKFNYIISLFNKSNNKNFLKVNSILNKKINNYKFNIKTYIKNIFSKYIKKSLNKEIFYFRYKQAILFNKLKFTNNLLLPLKKLLTKIYKKKIEFKIINIKYYYLNSDIMLQIIVTKLKNRKNKSRALKVFTSCLNNIKTPILKDINIVRERNKIIGVYNKTITKFLITNSNIDEKLNNTINKFINMSFIEINKSDKQNIVIDKIKHKVLTGIRIQGSGRLTKRFTAARSIHKYKYIGRLKNMDSTYKGLSTVMLRGNKKSNVQYTLLNNKTRIGAFGIKGWIAGY